MEERISKKFWPLTNRESSNIIVSMNSIRVYDPDGIHWRETFRTEDFDDALGEWQAECEGDSYYRRVELVEESIVEVSEP